MSIYIYEYILNHLNKLSIAYCSILVPDLRNIKLKNKKLYLSTDALKEMKLFDTNIMKYFYNFSFDLKIVNIEDMNNDFSNINDLHVTLDLYDPELEDKKDQDLNFFKELDLPFNNLSGINYLELVIPNYYIFKNNTFSVDNIKIVKLSLNSDVYNINLKNVNSFHLDRAFSLKTIIFDQHLQKLDLNKPNTDIIQSLNSEFLEELSITSAYFDQEIEFNKKFPNLKTLILDFSLFKSNYDFKTLYGNYKSFSINYCKTYFNDFSGFKCLKDLFVVGNHYIENIKGFNGKNLYLDSCSNLKTFNFQNLNHLYLCNNSLITGKDTENFKNIKTLDLSYTNIEYLSDSIDNLKIFVGTGCINLKYFPNYYSLQLLNLSSCQNLKKILTPNINTLNIYDCKNLDNLNELNVKQIV
jgi:hypothetical protein